MRIKNRVYRKIFWRSITIYNINLCWKAHNRWLTDLSKSSNHKVKQFSNWITTHIFIAIIVYNVAGKLAENVVNFFSPTYDCLIWIVIGLEGKHIQQVGSIHSILFWSSKCWERSDQNVWKWHGVRWYFVKLSNILYF